MFDFVRTHKRVLQFVLVLLVFPAFALFGVQGYSRFTEPGAAEVARVGGAKITQNEWDAAHQNQVNRLRQQMPGLDASMFETPQMKRNTLDALVRQKLLEYAAAKLHLQPTDERLQRYFRSSEEYASLRNADGSLRRDALGGMNTAQFEALLRQEIATRQVLAGVTETAVAPAAAASTALQAYFQQREVQVTRFEPKDFTAKVSASDAEVKAFYDDPANAAQFQALEEASVEYVVLDIEAIKRAIKLDDAKVKEAYDKNIARYTTPEERRVRHILIAVAPGAPAADKDKARAKATAVLDEVKKNPAAFADVAKKESQDPGSAGNGGDLDYLTRGATISQSFEDAAFALKKGDVSSVVESDSGFHIIQVSDIRGGEKKPFEQVRAEIEDGLKRETAQSQFVTASETFTDTVFQQFDSFAPVAEKLKLEVKRADKVGRTPAPGTQGALAHPKLLEALFGAESVQKKRNTQAVEIGPSQLASARVLTHTPARKLPLADVTARVREAVVARKAAQAARDEGQAKLGQWRANADGAALQPAVLVSRAQPQNLPREVVEAVLRDKADKLPAWIGVDLGAQGYAVAKLQKVTGPDPALLASDPQGGRGQYTQAWAAAEADAYYSALKERFKVRVAAKAEPAASAPQ
jgi:peptidyl-prolyl cis-trans isomerase D